MPKALHLPAKQLLDFQEDVVRGRSKAWLQKRYPVSARTITRARAELCDKIRRKTSKAERDLILETKGNMLDPRTNAFLPVYTYTAEEIRNLIGVSAATVSRIRTEMDGRKRVKVDYRKDTLKRDPKSTWTMADHRAQFLEDLGQLTNEALRLAYPGVSSKMVSYWRKKTKTYADPSRRKHAEICMALRDLYMEESSDEGNWIYFRDTIAAKLGITESALSYHINKLGKKGRMKLLAELREAPRKQAELEFWLKLSRFPTPEETASWVACGKWPHE